ncbi:hypothetical protein SCHPADRAFT_248414 [Schizopora paradoxa]|uniref:Uncharacterized protein n=1 Tax=Schizopora paradoxa TaxID=27342 RepID=A0A0H2SF83_9AGAM|nr:hypothetical protein SCHPADRAFT_248414 [Schizopora paradoxa]
MLIAKDLPPELLDRIFQRCERRMHPGSWAHQLREETCVPKPRLHPLLLVCKKWHDVAERRLYSSVSLGRSKTVRDKTGKTFELTDEHVCRILLETVQNNTRIASLIREINARNPRRDVEMFKMQFRIIGTCKNIEKIHVDGYGCNGALLNDLKATLAKVTGLTSLELLCHRLEPVKERDVVFLSDVMGLLPNWPRIETIYGSLGNEDNYYHGPTQVPSALNACPVLRSVSIHNDTFSPSHLRCLGDVAPRLEEIYIIIGFDCADALRGSLQIWSTSLKRIEVHTPLYRGGTFPADQCPVIRIPMTELRKVSMSAPLLSVKALDLLPKLEDLHLRGHLPEGMDLVRLIRGGKMPHLRILDAYFLKSMDLAVNLDQPDTVEDERKKIEISVELEKACKELNISFRGTFVERYTDYEDYNENSVSSDGGWWEPDNPQPANDHLEDDDQW